MRIWLFVTLFYRSLYAWPFVETIKNLAIKFKRLKKFNIHKSRWRNGYILKMLTDLENKELDIDMINKFKWVIFWFVCIYSNL